MSRYWVSVLVDQRDSLHGRLVQLLTFFSERELAIWTESAAQNFNRLRKAKVPIGTQDLRIASIAVSLDALLLSANLRDFQLVPGLRVEDWLHS
jgi:tRNA(fMet)-specific endonuclease VapC